MSTHCSIHDTAYTCVSMQDWDSATLAATIINVREKLAKEMLQQFDVSDIHVGKMDVDKISIKMW